MAWQNPHCCRHQWRAFAALCCFAPFLLAGLVTAIGLGFSIVTDSNRIQVFAGGRLDGQSGNAERRRGRRGHERQANETHCCTARSVNVVLLPSPTQFPAVRTENGFGVSISGAWVCLRMMVTKTVTVPRNSTGRPPMSGP